MIDLKDRPGTITKGMDAWLAEWDPGHFGGGERREAVGTRRLAKFWIESCADMDMYTDLEWKTEIIDGHEALVAYAYPPERR